MKRISYLIIFLLGVQFTGHSQDELNSYKYIVVPNQFDFLDEPDKYQLNSLIRFLFNKYGYNAFLKGDDLPSDLRKNPCLGLIADLDEVKGGFLKTKVQINLLDCNDKLIVESQVGESRIKDFTKAHHAAVRQAFETFQYFDYSYKPSKDLASSTILQTDESVANTTETRTEIEKLQQEVKELKNSKSKENQEYLKSQSVVIKDQNTELKSKDDSVYLNKPLYAQPMGNGFQIVDTEPKKVMFLLKTSLTDVYNVEGKNALVYKKDGQWIYESQESDSPKKTVIDLKF